MFKRYTPLTTIWKEILNQIEDQNLLKISNRIKSNPYKRDNTKYCKFYRDHSHNIEECFKLKEKIENFIRREQLRHFVAYPNRC